MRLRKVVFHLLQNFHCIKCIKNFYILYSTWRNIKALLSINIFIIQTNISDSFKIYLFSKIVKVKCECSIQTVRQPFKDRVKLKNIWWPRNEKKKKIDKFQQRSFSYSVSIKSLSNALFIPKMMVFQLTKHSLVFKTIEILIVKIPDKLNISKNIFHKRVISITFCNVHVQKWYKPAKYAISRI